jgi:bacterioferritin
MKGSPEVIKVLNEVLRKELTGINQYFVHSKMCKNWGYEVLAGVHWKESIDEMTTPIRWSSGFFFSRVCRTSHPTIRSRLERR